MNIIKQRKIFYSLSTLLIAIAIAMISFWGINFGIDFTGGSLIKFSFEENRPSQDEVRANLADISFLDDYSLREVDDSSIVLRSETLDNSEKNQIVQNLQGSYQVQEERFSTVGPVLGSQLQDRAIIALSVSLIIIVIFVAAAFRHVSRPVPSWKYGIITIMALIHDIIIPIGAFAAFGFFLGVEVDTLFVVALLVIIGYSINDTIVVFDRIRENLMNVSDDEKRIKNFDNIIEISLRETISRSISTSLTTILALLALYIFGGQVTQYFSLALIVGVLAGTYSSIFLASPLLVTLKGKEGHGEKSNKDKESK